MMAVPSTHHSPLLTLGSQVTDRRLITVYRGVLFLNYGLSPLIDGRPYNGTTMIIRQRD